MDPRELFTKAAPAFRLSLLFLFAISKPGLLTAQPGGLPGLSQALQLRLQEEPGSLQEVYILFDSPLNVRALADSWQRAEMPIAERSARLIPALQEEADSRQKEVRALLFRHPEVDRSSIRSFWAINTLFAELPASLIYSLSQRPEVVFIDLNHPVELDDEAQTCGAAVLPSVPNGSEPGLQAINAPAMWAEGYTGYGRKALIVDSGQEGDHPALRNQFAYQNYPLEQAWAGNGAVDAVSSHGSHVTGTVVGLDRLTRDTIGVAFNGMWMGGPSNLGSPDPNPTFQSLLYNLQWALNPDGDPETVEDLPDVINNSWTSGPVDCAAQRALYENLFATYDALGIAVVFSAGNSGPDPSTITSPKFLFLDSINIFAVGNINGNNSGFFINTGSSRGPSPCQGTDQERIKPEVVAPGTFVRSAVRGGGYNFFTGTSMAAPHAAGAVLLLKEAFPFLPGKTLLNALYQSAVDLGPAGEENTYGRGLIDVYAAYQYLIQQGHLPVPPADRSNDLILLDTELDFLNCKGEVPLRVYAENGGQQEVNSLEVVFITRSGDLRDTTRVFWEGSLLPGERQWLDAGGLTAPVGERIEAQVILDRPNGQADSRPLNNSLKREILVIESAKVPAASADGTRACSGSQVLLESAFDGAGQVRWYEQAEGGEPIAEGRSVVLDAPEQDSDFTVFAETEYLTPVGKEGPEANAMLMNAREGLVFDCIQPFVLRSVKVVAESGGNRLIRLRIPEGGVINKVVNVPGPGEHRIPLDLEISPGEGYELFFYSGQGLLAEQGPGLASYPYGIPGVLNITGSTISKNFYYYFYDWEVAYLDPCGRTAVEVPLNATAAAPVAAFSPTNSTVDLASGGVVFFADESQGAEAWHWDFGDGNTSSLPNPAHTYADTGRYEVSLQVRGASSCTDVFLSEVQVVNTTRTLDPNGLDDFVRVFPNPTSGWVQVAIQTDIEERLSVRIVDMLGRDVLPERLLRTPGRMFQLDLNKLSEGSYMLILQSDEGRAVKRILRM